MTDVILREIVRALWPFRHRGVGPGIALRAAFALREPGPKEEGEDG